MKTVYFDGVCNLCNGWVRFLRKHDKQQKLKILSLQSEDAKRVLGATPELLSLQTIVFTTDSEMYFASDAVIMILKELNFPYSWLGTIFKYIPKSLRDKVYFYIAKHRYKWFGTCEIGVGNEKGL